METLRGDEMAQRQIIANLHAQLETAEITLHNQNRAIKQDFTQLKIDRRKLTTEKWNNRRQELLQQRRNFTKEYNKGKEKVEEMLVEEMEKLAVFDLGAHSCFAVCV